MVLFVSLKKGVNEMKILFVGDIVGKSGRNIVINNLPALINKYNIDFVIANGENATHGKGIIENHYNSLLRAGVDVITLGNHYNSKSEINEFINGADYLIRPYNLINDFGGVGTAVYEVGDIRIRVTNLLGEAFMLEEVNNPFDALKEIIDNEEKTEIHIVDFHAEATGEKQALAWAFDGLVTAVIGTHTHVQTHDERVLKNGTGFMCDVGMCGPYNGILGAKREVVIGRLWNKEKIRYEIESEKGSILSAVVLDIDENNGTTRSIKSIKLIDEHI